MGSRRADPAEPADPPPDDTVAELARLFREHPAWREAASRIREGSTSGVWFTWRPGEPWHLVRQGRHTFLRRGRAEDPDFVFRFAPGAVRALAEVDGGVGDFAVRLFECMAEPDPERRVDLRIAASFARLVRRGYVRLLLGAGTKVARFAARHGVTGPRSLRRLVSALRRDEPYPWERELA